MSGTLVFGILVGCLHFYKATDPPFKSQSQVFSSPPSYPTSPPPKWWKMNGSLLCSGRESNKPCWGCKFFVNASGGRTVLQLPTNSYHLSMVVLALKGVLCSHHPWQWRVCDTWICLLIDLMSMPCWWAPIRAKQLSMTATAGVIWMCACIR